MIGPQTNWLTGGRLHLNHGPIDLIIKIWGGDSAQAYTQAVARFASVLDELVSELPALRRPLTGSRFDGTVAERMAAAVCPFGKALFVTPMAAVAGAVADEICTALSAGTDIGKAYVNNGGDIAVYLQGHARLDAGIFGGGHLGNVTLTGAQPVRGLATSGWRGRSHSLGIADTVTVLATTAAAADVAATLIANAVDVPSHPNIVRQAANELSPDSDLGARPVTVDVGALLPQEIDRALDAGANAAQAMRAQGHIIAAALFLGDAHRIVGAKHFPGSHKGPTNARLQTA